MKKLSYRLEIITPCFSGGAEPEQAAEIRSASIRGQLRWWFRVLGGFKSLSPDSVEKQEAEIFGSIAGGSGTASKLLVRARPLDLKTSRKDSEGLGHRPFSDSAYLTFPMQSRRDQSGSRGVIESGFFELVLIWRGNPAVIEDLNSLIAVFANFGSLGFRSRRAMGALAPVGPALPHLGWQDTFSDPGGILVRTLPARNSEDAIRQLGGWLRRWRSHGRSSDHNQNNGDRTKPPLNPGFDFAKRDHDIGYGMAAAGQPAFRPALGLPIVQRIQGRTNNWNWGKGSANEPKGRFASPIILRPHRDPKGNWWALVIFVEARRWPTGKPAYIDGRPVPVSDELYETMKADPTLQDLPQHT